MQFLAFVLASLAASAYAADLVVNTPTEVVQCGETDISWTGGSAPYSVVIKDNGSIVGESNRIFSTSYAWGGYGAPAGSSVVFTISDNTGAQASTAAVTVSDSSDTSCLDPGA